MIDEKNGILGYVSQSTINSLKSNKLIFAEIFITSQKFLPDDVPYYYRKPESPSVVMNNLFECLASINNLFDERSK